MTEQVEGVRSFTIVFDDPGEPGPEGVARDEGDEAETFRGWVGDDGPDLGDAHWPRGTYTGLPMVHVLTLELPEEYRRRAADLVALSVFQGEGPGRSSLEPAVGDASSDDPFLRQLAQYEPDVGEERRLDPIDGEFVLLWLTQEEFDRGPAAPPEDVRLPGTRGAELDEGPNAWDFKGNEVMHFRLEEREDPNAGRVPGGSAYVAPVASVRGGAPQPWAGALRGTMHLGGTMFPSHFLPAGFSPYYLEIDEIDGMLINGGRAQIDLDTLALSWA